jgi:uroporphyrinogen-III synthase
VKEGGEVREGGESGAGITGLKGKRIAITRPADRAASLAALLRPFGAELAAYPLIQIKAPAAGDALRAAPRALADYDWVVVTSGHAVSALRAALDDSPWPARVRVAAVGDETARALAGAGIPVDLVPPEARAEALADALVAHAAPASTGAPTGASPTGAPTGAAPTGAPTGAAPTRPSTGTPPGTPTRASTQTPTERPLTGLCILFPRSDRARRALPERLKAAGATVDEIEAYRTVLDRGRAQELCRALGAGELIALVFTSPSNVEALAREAAAGWPGILAGVQVVAIGPATTAELAGRGRPADQVAATPDPGGLLEALLAAVG